MLNIRLILCSSALLQAKLPSGYEKTRFPRIVLTSPNFHRAAGHNPCSSNRRLEHRNHTHRSTSCSKFRLQPPSLVSYPLDERQQSPWQRQTSTQAKIDSHRIQYDCCRFFGSDPVFRRPDNNFSIKPTPPSGAPW